MPTLCHHLDENLESLILSFYQDDHSLRLAGAERGGKRLKLFGGRGARREEWRGSAHYQANGFKRILLSPKS